MKGLRLRHTIRKGHPHHEGRSGEHIRDHTGKRYSPVKLSGNWKSSRHNPIYYIAYTEEGLSPGNTNAAEVMMEKRKVYFDHNATTPLHPEVKKTMIELMDVFGNPSSLHGFGRQARGYVEDARAKIADFIGAESDEVMFVGSGSEANNTVLSILTNQCRQCNFDCRSGRGLITTTIEHPCIMEASKCLFERGVDVSYIEVDQYGKVNMDQIREKVTPGTGLVSVMMANNEIGTIQDIRTIAEIVHEKGALFHTDAVQAVGKIPVNVKDLDVDFLTLSGHKIYGPKGIGALYVRRGAPFCPLTRRNRKHYRNRGDRKGYRNAQQGNGSRGETSARSETNTQGRD